MTDSILLRRTMLLAPLAALAACAQPPAPETAAPAPAAPQVPVGHVTIRRRDLSFMGNVAWGRGTLTFGRQTRAFRMHGLGAGGIGFSRMDAEGDVFNLSRIEDFPGVYGQVRAGVVVGSSQVEGFIWLQNTNGVRIRLQPRRRGLALASGADGIVVELLPETPARR